MSAYALSGGGMGLVRIAFFVFGLMLAFSPGTSRADDDPFDLAADLDARMSGDLDAILLRGTLRVLVEYGPTRFFIDGGRLRGFEFELFDRFVEHLRSSVPEGRRLNVVYVPLPFSQILPKLMAGYGDIAAATLTITPDRERLVQFSRPYLTDVREVVVAGRGTEPPTNLEALSGAVVHVASGTSYVDSSLSTLNALSERGFEPVRIEQHDLASEALLEMANAGIVDYVVVDDFEAQLWSAVLPNITVSDVALAEGDQIAWAMRLGTPKLKAVVDAYLAENRKGTLVGNVLFKRYFQSTKWIDHPLDDHNEVSRLHALRPLFEAASQELSVEWLLLAAQGYQESRLDQSVVSAAGAVGIMQILPSTAADPVLGGADIHVAEGNILGGARYVNHLRRRYETVGEGFDPWAFAFAAYNAGPARLEQARSLARRSGLDPDRWDGNVEHALMELVGIEPVRYVGNIRKYYVAYRLGLGDAVDRSVTAAE
ncbi:MAG: transporter substrate-binding domain-containing protein [Alphaproteobacteria bacterium]|nr:transporter substrate-binding domain-containing protein [Alphaproteobacteria bacterium]